MTDCRLLIDPPAAGAWNMAVDEWLWHWAGKTGRWCLRFYRWEGPTLSLGYFQNYEDRQQHPPSLSCPVVRRISGGGAIVHDVEWTYSLAVPLKLPTNEPRANQTSEGLIVSRNSGCGRNMPRQWLYEVVHGTIVELLAHFGVHAQICGKVQEGKKAAALPFLCFQRRSPGDVLVGPIKVAGSAQRRNNDALLQHGSLLLARSLVAPELPGLKEIAGREFPFEFVLEVWLARLSDRLRLSWAEEQLSETERAAIDQLVLAKHNCPAWVIKRTRPELSMFFNS